MFMHFSIMMIISKKKGEKFDQQSYDYLFNSIENNLRELGFGDVAVNKKMKEFNKILYDILLKIEIRPKNQKKFEINQKLVANYFSELNDRKSAKFLEFKSYFLNFFHFCFEIHLDNMVREAIKFKN